MKLGRIIGQVIPCEVYQGLEGVPLLWVQPLDKKGRKKGKPVVAADATRMAGPDEMIYYEGGREAALALDPWFVPVDHAIIGIVDNLQVADAPSGHTGKTEEAS
jgi:ethanolamine utilization protein EutN